MPDQTSSFLHAALGCGLATNGGGGSCKRSMREPRPGSARYHRCRNFAAVAVERRLPCLRPRSIDRDRPSAKGRERRCGGRRRTGRRAAVRCNERPLSAEHLGRRRLRGLLNLVELPRRHLESEFIMQGETARAPIPPKGLGEVPQGSD